MKIIYLKSGAGIQTHSHLIIVSLLPQPLDHGSLEKVILYLVINFYASVFCVPLESNIQYVGTVKLALFMIMTPLHFITILIRSFALCSF